MILSRKFPKGRMANGLFQYAYLRALSERTGVDWALPIFPASQYFKMGRKWHIDENEKVDITRKEPFFDFNKDFMTIKDKKKNINFIGYFQSPKYFDDVWDKIKEDFYFEEDFRKRFDSFKVKNTDWSVHVRRGDYVGHKRYFNLSPEYYIDFFKEHPKETFYIFSDDPRYCMETFTQENVVIIDGYSDIESLCLMSKFKNHLIANSSFSWWGARIAELYNKDVTVIRPNLLFRIKIENSTGSDFYSENWKPMFDWPSGDNTTVKLNDYYNLSDITFVIPVSYDSKDRRENLDLVHDYIRTFFGEVKIIVAEQGSGGMFKYMRGKKNVRYFYYDDIRIWHRTKILNRMIKEADTKYVAIWDADVMVYPEYIFDAYAMLSGQGYDAVYPYDGCFVKMKKSWRYKIAMDMNMVNKLTKIYDGMTVYKHSYGGAVIVNKNSYLKAGLENENFKVWGREDVERYERLTKLGFNVGRTDGYLYHLEHYLGDNSTSRNDYTKQNNFELDSVRKMSREELRKYVDSWGWAK